MKAHLEIVYSDPGTGEPISTIFTAVDNLQQLILLQTLVEEKSDHITTILARCKYRTAHRSVRQLYFDLMGMMRGNEFGMASATLPYLRCSSAFTTARTALFLVCRDLRNIVEHESHPKEELRQILPALTQFLEQSK